MWLSWYSHTPRPQQAVKPPHLQTPLASPHLPWTPTDVPEWVLTGRNPPRTGSGLNVPRQAPFGPPLTSPAAPGPPPRGPLRGLPHPQCPAGLFPSPPLRTRLRLAAAAGRGRRALHTGPIGAWGCPAPRRVGQCSGAAQGLPAAAIRRRAAVIAAGDDVRLQPRRRPPPGPLPPP